MKRLAILFFVIIALVQTAVPSTRIFASADGLVLTLSTNKAVVQSGEEFSYFINYSASSTIPNYVNPSISLHLPAGVTYMNKTDSSITTSTYDGSGLVTFTFKTGELPAGSTGQLVVTGKMENYTTPDGTSATAKAQFHAVEEGSPVSIDSNPVTVTANASASWGIQIRKVAPVVEPFKGSDVQYEINVQPTSSGYGLLDIQNVILTAKLADGAVFVSADNGGTQGPDNTVIWNLADGIRGLKSVKVVVNYPDSITATEVTSDVTLTYTPIGQAPNSVFASMTHGFAVQPIDRGTAPTVSKKNGVKEISPGQTVTFNISDLSNNANIELQNGVLELMTPTLTESSRPIQFQLQTIKTATFSDIPVYDLYYTSEENPSAGDWTHWTTTNASAVTTLDATALGNIKGIQVRFGGSPIMWKQLGDFELTYKLDDSTSLPVDSSETIKQLAQYQYSFDGSQKSSTGSSKIDIVDHRPLLELSNTASKSSVVPNETMTYTFSVTNHAQLSSANLDNPVINNMLPAELEYMPGTWTVVKPAGMPSDPIFTAVPQPLGETKLTWSWDDGNPEFLQIGEKIQIKFDAKIKPGTHAKTITNTFSVESPRYLNDVNYSNVKTVGIELYRVKADSDITVSESTALQSEMWVKGELDSDWSKYPDTGLTTPGGNALYRLSVVNVGNEPLKDLVIVNPLPRIGDKAVLNGSVPRGSQWGPVLTGSVVAPSYVTVYYSTTPSISMDPTTGADNGVWMMSLPVDPTSVQAIKIVFDPDYAINPLDTMTLEWVMKAPVGAPTVGEIAWNSFAYKMNKASGQSILPAEPPKVGIRIQSSPKASIGDFVWLDSNENGILDGAEAGMNGVTVELYDELGTKLAQTVTSNDFNGNPGSYLFPHLDPGNYRVQFKPDSQYEKISSDLITIAAGEQYLQLDEGIVAKKGKIGNYVWLDSNENGLQDAAESGINGVTVKLYDGTSTLLATTTTATFNGLPGHYEFSNLSPGNYQVGFVRPAGYKFTQQGAGSSVEPSTGRTAVVALALGEKKVGIDAGLIHLALPLNIQFEANGNASPAKTAASKVTLTDTESRVDAASLEYVWTQSTTVPTGGWTAFASGDTLTHTGEDGSWYLHIRAIDRIGNPAYAVSNAFVLKAPATTNTANNRVSASPSTVTAGDTVTLTATGDRQLVAGVVIGDERYIPTSWSSTESGKSGTFILDSGNYYTSYMPSTAGSYTVTVTFKKQRWGGDDWEDAGEDTKTVVVTVNSVPTYSIAALLDRTLSALIQGYASGQQETATIDVINTGTGDLANVTATLSGADANAFVLTPPSDAIGSGSASSLTITAKDGLAAGSYTATVTVSADLMTSVTFTVSQVVKPVSSWPPNVMYVQHVEDLVDITGLPNGTAKTAAALGLPSQIEVTLSDGSTIQTEVSWNVAEASYDPASTDKQTFTVTGNLVNLPSGITNPQNLTASIQITVEATHTETKDIISVHTPSAIIGLPNGTKKTTAALRLPKQVEATLSDDSTVPVAVKWDVAKSDYEPVNTEAQTFTVTGTLVKLPNGVTNSQNLTTSIQVSVKAADAVENPKDIVSVSKPAAIKGVANGTAKKASALGLPEEIEVILDDDTTITLPVKWDVAGTEYDPTNEDKQTFTVTGSLIKLPDNVTNSQNLTVSIRVTVDAAKRRDRDGGNSRSSGSESSGNKVMEVTLDKKNVKEILQKALGNNQDVVRFIIDDLLKDPADEIWVKVAKNALDLIKEQQVSLQIQIGDVTITLPREMIAALSQDELSFRVVPVKKRTEQQAIVKRTLQAEEVQKAAGGQDVQVVSKPIVIETNYKNNRTKVMFSLKDVQLPTDPQAQKAFLASLAIYVEHTDGEKELKNGKIQYDKKGKPVGIEIEITKFSTFTILALKAKQEQVEHTPYMTGYPDQTFKPNHALTRAEMAAILAHFLKEEQPAEAEFPADIPSVSTSPFGDVPATHWAASAIQLVQSAGLMTGNGNGLFQPNAKITRAEMAAIITKWNQLPASGEAARFTDTNGHWAEASIVGVVEAGVMNGYENGSFRPNQGLTRAEAVTLFNRLTGRGPLTGIAQTSWSDVPVTHWAFTEIMEAAVPHVALKRADGAEVVTKEQTN